MNCHVVAKTEVSLQIQELEAQIGQILISRLFFDVVIEYDLKLISYG